MASGRGALLALLPLLSGCTGLVGAAKMGKLDVVKEELAAGAKPSKVTRALCAAAAKGRVESVTLLYPASDKARAANAHCACADKPYLFATPMVCAILEDKPQVVEALLAAGEPVDRRTHIMSCPDGRELGWTPLAVAARRGRLEIVKLLLAKGADTSAKSLDPEARPFVCKTEGATALSWAEDKRNEEIAALLKAAPAAPAPAAPAAP